LNEKQANVKRRLVELGYNKAEVRGKDAIVASGIAASYVSEIIPSTTSFAKIGAYPIDEVWLKEFISGHERVLVIEELSPFVEEEVLQVAGTIPVFGKKSGNAPYEGELSPAAVGRIMKSAGFETNVEFPVVHPLSDVPPRPPILCAGCMHRAVFYAIKRVFREGIFPSDIGCYTLGLQLGGVDTTICMGASITVASGIAHSGEKRDVVCTIGDSTFLHTGIQGLMNAVYNNATITVVILDNRITAMTGHQPNPSTGVTACGTPVPPVSLESICRSCGVSFVETIDPSNLTLMMNVLKRTKGLPGVKVVIARHPCVISARRAGMSRRTYVVDTEKCTACGTCIRFGCPAIELAGEKTVITTGCSGCSLCAQICPSGAIIPGGKK
ncbi:indolepyruvate ferredoxin oxidoreductase subunit alpha, partial [bacterium]